jgi:hypothetical protein
MVIIVEAESLALIGFDAVFPAPLDEFQGALESQSLRSSMFQNSN